MKKIIVFFFFLSLSLIGSAQVRKKIGFIPYTDPDNADVKYRELAYKNIYDAALRVFVNTQRFDVLDRGSFDVVKIEKEFQKGEDLANVEIIDQGKVAAAELLAVAKLSTFTITDSDDGKGFSVYITAEFKQIDVETGRATNAYQLEARAIDSPQKFGGLVNNANRISTIEESISIAVGKMEEDLERWIKSSFPMILKVIDIDQKDRRIIVEGGRSEGLNEKFKMKAVTIKMYGDKILMSTLGELKFLKEGVGEQLTFLEFNSKKDWEIFVQEWKENQSKIYVTEDL